MGFISDNLEVIVSVAAILISAAVSVLGVFLADRRVRMREKDNIIRNHKYEVLREINASLTELINLVIEIQGLLHDKHESALHPTIEFREDVLEINNKIKNRIGAYVFKANVVLQLIGECGYFGKYNYDDFDNHLRSYSQSFENYRVQNSLDIEDVEKKFNECLRGIQKYKEKTMQYIKELF